ncbi:MAG: SDR family NAD(P)-dependent oxidoreductase [Saprospiraceae bacterium]|nr:SDR family NAD(P)-dependent oxidoreductase [Saprospiraceae bacterium]MBK7811552.1 SDR family NAD(P)-dependent oxidoreductase [Saprospiraceae bacterium]MBK9631737.1 SDR family NAD(P)-dependent oxidoreductase [Saprospiraceae bacterium]
MKNENANIFITGVGSGIGKALMAWFYNDYNLIVSVRKQEERLQIQQQYPSAKVILLDFENELSVSEAFLELGQILDDKGLYALINNAGIAKPGPVAYLTAADWMQQYQVNVFGVISAIRAVYPHLIKYGPGARIINVSSVSGKFASPFLGAYASSKFALEAISDSLRRESSMLGIKVILIEPGPLKTNIWSKNMGVGMKFENTVFGPMMQRADQIIQATESSAMPLEKLRPAFEAALLSAHPKARYLVHKHPILFRIFVYFVPSKWADYLVKRQFKQTNQNKFRPI